MSAFVRLRYLIRRKKSNHSLRKQVSRHLIFMYKQDNEARLFLGVSFGEEWLPRILRLKPVRRRQIKKNTGPITQLVMKCGHVWCKHSDGEVKQPIKNIFWWLQFNTIRLD